MTLYHTFLASCWYVEECLSSMTRPSFVSLLQRVETLSHIKSRPSGFMSRLSDLVSAMCPASRHFVCSSPQLSVVIMSVTGCEPRTVQRGQSKRSGRCVPISCLWVPSCDFFFLAWRPVIVTCSVTRLSVIPYKKIPGLCKKQFAASTHTFSISP